MLILNFSHPFTNQQLEQIEKLAGTFIEEVRNISVRIDQEALLSSQITAIVDATGLSASEWQARSLLVNLPGFTPAAFVLLAELHGRTGHFPSLIRLRPKAGPVTIHEVMELLNLQEIREASRRRR